MLGAPMGVHAHVAFLNDPHDGGGVELLEIEFSRSCSLRS